MAMSKNEAKELLANYRFKYVAVSDNAKTGKMSAINRFMFSPFPKTILIR